MDLDDVCVSVLSTYVQLSAQVQVHLAPAPYHLAPCTIFHLAPCTLHLAPCTI